MTVNNIATFTGINGGYQGGRILQLAFKPESAGALGPCAACCGIVKTTTQERKTSLATDNQIEDVENRKASADLSVRDVCDKTEIAFVDPNVAHQGILAKAWRDNVEAIVLEATRTADEQICAALQSCSNVKAIHILAHGCPGK